VRDAPASIAAMLGTTQLTLARCAKLVLRDGTELGFTDHDRDLVVPLDNDLYEPITYRAGFGMISGEIDLALGLEADNTEVTFPINEMISRAAVLARRFHMADAYLFDVDWTQDAPEAMEIMAGYVGDARPERNMAIFEIRSQADRWNTTIGRLLNPRCKADFGDVLCGKTPTVYETTVVEAISNMRFRVGLPDNFADDFFRYGTAEFTSGALGSTWPFEIIAFDGYLQEVEVLSPMPGFPANGDTVLLRNGCSRVKKADDPTVPTCLTHDNVLRFRGFDQVPGTDRFVRFPIPGAAGETA
jgi:uncharacterized phage protein (TIGR02218 family)